MQWEEKCLEERKVTLWWNIRTKVMASMAIGEAGEV